MGVHSRHLPVLVPSPSSGVFGATVPDILDKTPGLLLSPPSSISRVIIHVGTNNLAREQSELTKKDFNGLLSFLCSCGKSVFISGPILTVVHGAGHFSRLLSLHSWLQSASTALHIGFIDHFNLFWEHSAFFRSDGLHPNTLGSRMLVANVQYAVQSAAHD